MNQKNEQKTKRQKEFAFALRAVPQNNVCIACSYFRLSLEGELKMA